jgi:hypothetical protein
MKGQNLLKAVTPVNVLTTLVFLHLSAASPEAQVHW